jgi:hypothetical protein
MSIERPKLEPWEWPEETWRTMVGRARAGRSLKPASWPEGARCAVAISFDADHETIPLRDNDESRGAAGDASDSPAAGAGVGAGDVLLSGGVGAAASA